MGRSGQHAVVIGASIAGMCAARVLSDFFDRVTVYERDDLPADPANRSAVPQGKHLHLLLARGAEELEGHFPGLLDDMVAAGVRYQYAIQAVDRAGNVSAMSDRVEEAAR